MGANIVNNNNNYNNAYANQYSGYGYPGAAPLTPLSQGSAQMTTPTSYAQAMLRGSGTVQIGPFGVGGSVATAPGYNINATNTSNGLGMASPFATISSFLRNIGATTFGAVNPFSPLIGTPSDVPEGIAGALGSFGGYLYGNPMDNNIFPTAQNNSPASNLPGFSPVGASASPWQAAANPFANNGSGGGFPSLPSNAIPGLANTISQSGGGYGNQYNLVSDGIAKMFLQSEGDPNIPQSDYGANSSLTNSLGTFEFGIGSNGGNANAGVLGAQAAGNSWAMVRSPMGSIVSYANPQYDNTNWAQQS